MPNLAYQRLDDIVEYLLLHPHHPVPLKQFVQQLQVSDRTIRNDILSINETISQRHATVKLHRGKGYQLVYSDKHCFLEWWQNEKRISASSLVTMENRQDYLVYLLLTQSKPFSLEHLLDTLFISKNTFYSYLKTVKELFEPFHLKIYNRPNIGFELLGMEFNKRQAIMDLLIRKDLENYILNFSEMEYQLFQIIDLEKLQKMEIEELQILELFESDYYHKNLLSSLALTITRIKQNHTLKSVPVKVPKIKERVKLAFDQLLEQLEKEFAVIFSESEKEYLYFHLLTNFPRLADTNENSLATQKTAREIVYDLLYNIQKSTAYNWTTDGTLKKDLIAHIEAFIGLELYNNNRGNPLLETIKNSFPLAYDLSLINLEMIGKKYGFYFSENEIGYIALHLAGAIERNEPSSLVKMRVAVVCGSGMTMSKLISLKLEKKYGDFMTIIGNYSCLELTKNVPKDIDLIISTVPLTELAIPTQIIEINNLDRDLNELNRYFSKDQLSDNYLNKLFSAAHFHRFDGSVTKDHVLKMMTDKLVETNHVGTDYLASVLEREKIETTNISSSIAIPHPMALISKKTVISIGIIPEGVYWNDTEKIQFVFLFAIRKKDYEETETVYDLLLSFLDDSESQNCLIKNPSFTNFLRVMKGLSI